MIFDIERNAYKFVIRFGSNLNLLLFFHTSIAGTDLL